MTKATLEQCRNAELLTCDPRELVDLRDISIDTTRPKAERVDAFLRQVRNPYLFKVDSLVVKAVYLPGADRTLAEALGSC